MPVRPRGRILADFGTLGDAEQKLMESCGLGELCLVAQNCPGKNGRTPANTVRAAFLRFLILGGDDENPVDTRGVRIKGAWITGELILKRATSVGDFSALCCWFDMSPDLVNAHIKGDVNLSESRVPSLRGGGLVCDGSFFADGLDCAGLELWESAIGGNVVIRGATLTRIDPSIDPLSARRIKVGGNVNLENTTSGRLDLSSAIIGGRLELRSANLDEASGDSVFADGIEVGGDVLLAGGFKAKGTVRLSSATIRGKLDCTGATLTGPADSKGSRGFALEASNINVKEDVLLDGAAQDREDIQNLPFTAHGTVSLMGASIGGNLDCTGAIFDGPDYGEDRRGVALDASNILVAGNVVLKGATDFTYHLAQPNTKMPFVSFGTVNLMDAEISGNLQCSLAEFNAGFGWSIFAVRLSVSGIFYFSRFAKPVDQVSLEFAHVGVLADDETAWGERLNLNQFKYDLLANRFERDAAIRLAWLDKQIPQLSGKDGSHFDPQPWRQLRRVFTDAGYAADARKVGIALEDRRHKCGEVKGLLAKSWHLFRRFLNGYGYQPLYVFRPILVIWLSCAVIYSHAAARDKFIPADSSVYGDPGCKSQAPDNGGRLVNPVFTPPCGGNYPVFSPLIYSLNVILPVVDLGQERAWAPRAKPHSQIWWRNLIQPFTDFGSFIQLLVWLETLTGYLAGLYLASVISGLLTSPDDS